MSEAVDFERTVMQKQDAPAGECVFVAKVIDGPDRGRTLTLDGAQPSSVLVGQSPACALQLTDREVSRRHIALEPRAGRLHLRDLGSTNGTYLEKLRIIEAELSGGEVVRIGSTCLRFDRMPLAPASAPPPPLNAFGRLLGASPEMRRLYPLCARLARASIAVLVEGETGTGKELLAESLHEQGPRAQGPFIVFDCTAVPANLVESELFGHERGSFTGAVASRRGVFEQADGGTLLIDEIGELDLALQPKLLRALERSEVRRVGGDRARKFDVRVISATRRNLDQEVQAGRFRDDLFHRLAVARIELPPLRRRTGDIPRLARALWSSMGGDEGELPEALVRQWNDDAWPGNVRELRNAVVRRLALGEVELLEPSDAAATDDAVDPAGAAQGAHGAHDAHGATGILEHIISMGLPFGTARQHVLDAFERRYVERTLAEHGGNVMRAAAASGVARRHFQRVKSRSLK
ncbi:sigma 54-interacting transcriptional regulator [Pendulispora albinea]|uniref:Sigma 54-interacting transcriptional regulator n=1 Tax=Pendulispora albinea TaxID=2741071 RepID=A0ABZ2LXE8_9BACT